MKKLKDLFNRWREKHKLSYINDDTFHVRWSINVSLLNMLSVILFYTILVSFIFYILLIYTPLRRVIIDNLSVYELNEQSQNNSKDLLALKKQISIQEQYITNIKRILNEDSFVDTTSKPEMDTLEGIIHVEFSSSQADSILREKIEQSTVSNPTKISHSTDELGFFMSPVNGNITRSIAIDDKHYGIDVVTLADEPIKATLEGLVVLSEWTNGQGNVIIIQHSNNIITAYKHCSVLFKEAGTYVEAGDPIGIVGNTGELTDGPHLHFEIWQNGIPLDPQEFINF